MKHTNIHTINKQDIENISRTNIISQQQAEEICIAIHHENEEKVQEGKKPHMIEPNSWDILKNANTYGCVVATQENMLVGYMWFSENIWFENTVEAWWLFIMPQFRGNSLTKTFLMKILTLQSDTNKIIITNVPAVQKTCKDLENILYYYEDPTQQLPHEIVKKIENGTPLIIEPAEQKDVVFTTRNITF